MRERLKQYIDGRNITQRELADELGFTEEYISKILNAKVPVTAGFKMRFQETLGMDAYHQVFGCVECPEATA